MRYLIYITSALLLAAASGCATDECLDNQNSLPLAGFYSSTSVPQPVTLDSISLYGVGAPGDSLVLNNARSVSQTYLPFRIDEEETSFRIYYESTATINGGRPLYDEIKFSYGIEPWFVSSACGAIYKYKIRDISYTTLFLDSVTCPKGIIDNVPGQNIMFYFRVSQGGEDSK